MFAPVELPVTPFNVTLHDVPAGSPVSTKLTGTVETAEKSAVTLVTPFTVSVNGSRAVVGHADAGLHVHPFSTYPDAASAVTCTDELALYQFVPDGLTDPPVEGEAAVVTLYCVT